jgi:hypothetical protein
MVVGGIASNLTSVDAYLTLKPFLVNAKVERGFPFQLQTKILLTTGQALQSWASDAPVNMLWDLQGIDNWNSGLINNWNSASIADVSILLDLTVAEI